MRIGIDARCLEGQRGGVARFLTHMLTLWPRITDRHRFVPYFAHGIPEDDFLRHPSIENRVIAGPRRIRNSWTLCEQLLLPIQIKRDRLDLYFGTWYSSPLHCPCPKRVVAAWDISYTTHKEHYRLRERLRLSFFSRKSCQQAAGVVTCSSFDGRQIERHYGVPSESICVLQLAADERFKPVDDPRRLEALRRKYRLPNRYILSMGVIFNRRNVDVIIDAFKDVCRDYPDIGLLVVGRNKTTPVVDIEGRMRPLVEGGQGMYLPWIPEDELVDLYGGAWYYICTSTVDGESIMLKEAMQCGTPVVASPLLEESVGQNAVIVNDPSNRAEMAEVFHKIIPSWELRERNAAESMKWVRQFSWNKVARDSLCFLESR